MYLKVLLQEIWRAKTGWDEKIEDKHLEKWLTWLRILPELEFVEIPRCYFRHEAGIDNAIVELHTFVDASESGFAAVSYFRFEAEDHIECALIGSKTRVALSSSSRFLAWSFQQQLSERVLQKAFPRDIPSE